MIFDCRTRADYEQACLNLSYLRNFNVDRIKYENLDLSLVELNDCIVIWKLREAIKRLAGEIRNLDGLLELITNRSKYDYLILIDLNTNDDDDDDNSTDEANVFKEKNAKLNSIRDAFYDYNQSELKLKSKQ